MMKENVTSTVVQKVGLIPLGLAYLSTSMNEGLIVRRKCDIYCCSRALATSRDRTHDGGKVLHLLLFKEVGLIPLGLAYHQVHERRLMMKGKCCIYCCSKRGWSNSTWSSISNHVHEETHDEGKDVTSTVVQRVGLIPLGLAYATTSMKGDSDEGKCDIYCCSRAYITSMNEGLMMKENVTSTVVQEVSIRNSTWSHICHVMNKRTHDGENVTSTVVQEVGLIHLMSAYHHVMNEDS
ncbi:hypothetical protein AVEN_106723-1 [Araneus ventricosus]|uniref:Uncharacterized protein n=1 Tax=Araneus ventricosus TaxID=182803 RepID=A0A4Y2F1V1_ARAVE|nr:hypothetical protein AVEN_106723-1 [Araneus ventricosus]